MRGQRRERNTEGEADGIKKGGRIEKNREQMEEATKGRKRRSKPKHLSVLIDTQ